VRVTKNGVTYTAAKNAPSLPADVGKGVHAIIGLQPFRQAHKNSRRYVGANGNRAALDVENAAAPTTNIQNAPPYLVAEILKAYGASGLTVTGAGQTIAILIDTFPVDSDLKKFWTKNNLPVKIQQIEKINVQGGQLPAPEGEETLDAEWSSGIAPGAKIRIYASYTCEYVGVVPVRVRYKKKDELFAESLVLQQCPVQNQQCHAEVDTQSSHVHERRDEWRGARRRIEAEAVHQERQQASR